MTRGSEAKVKIKARDKTHSDKVIKKLSSCTVKKKPSKKRASFCFLMTNLQNALLKKVLPQA